MKALRLPGVHVNPDGSAGNVCLSRKEDTVGQRASKYRLGILEMSGGGSVEPFSCLAIWRKGIKKVLEASLCSNQEVPFYTLKA